VIDYTFDRCASVLFEDGELIAFDPREMILMLTLIEYDVHQEKKLGGMNRTQAEVLTATKNYIRVYGMLARAWSTLTDTKFTERLSRTGDILMDRVVEIEEAGETTRSQHVPAGKRLFVLHSSVFMSRYPICSYNILSHTSIPLHMKTYFLYELLEYYILTLSLLLSLITKSKRKGRRRRKRKRRRTRTRTRTRRKRRRRRRRRKRRMRTPTRPGKMMILNAKAAKRFA